jgi:hypothetical protein
MMVRQPKMAKLDAVRADDPNDSEDARLSCDANTETKCPRRFGRLPQETLSCNLGEVLDLSAGGMRIGCSVLPAAGPLAIIMDEHPMAEPIRGTVVWTRAVEKPRRHEFGVQFESLTAEQITMLTAIARDYRFRRSM